MRHRIEGRGREANARAQAGKIPGEYNLDNIDF